MYCRRSDKGQKTAGRLPVVVTLTTRSQRGAALIVALLVFAVASALMVGLQRDFTLQLQRGSNAFIAEQGWAYLRGAEALAATALRFDADQDRERGSNRDDLSEVWASEATPYPLPEGGWLLGQLEDLQGRLNLNSLVNGSANSGSPSGDEGSGKESSSDTDAAPENGTTEQGTLGQSTQDGGAPGSDGARFNTAQKMLIRLLQSLEGPAINQGQAIALTEAITDFIDSDNQRRFDGAEDEAYRNTQPPYRTANQPMASVSELRSVSGMTPEIYQLLAPLVTVWPVEGAPLNILTAKPEVLRCLNTDERLEPLSPADTERLAELRANGEIDSVTALLEDITFSSGSTTGLREEIVEASGWFLLSASVQLGDRETRLFSVLERNDRRVVSRYRSLGEL